MRLSPGFDNFPGKTVKPVGLYGLQQVKCCKKHRSVGQLKTFTFEQSRADRLISRDRKENRVAMTSAVQHDDD